ncbi:MAG: type II secretion system F family protein, partial [Chloroflexi bacterium]|nr:type II secretion system F family protein [Chloroflexota bacterium]
RELRQAHVRLRAGEFVLARWLLAAMGFVLPALLTQLQPVGLAAGALGALAGYATPGWWLAAARRRRVVRIEKQLVEFLPLLASSLRSGFALQQGIESAARRLGPPLGEELSALVSDLRLGASMPVLLEELRARIGSKELDIIVTAILVQRTTGGNLAEVLDHAAETLLERERIRGELATLTAQQRLTGLILSVYPVAVGLLLLLIMPNVWSRLFTEPAGQVQLAIAGSLQVVGFLAIRRTLRVEY